MTEQTAGATPEFTLGDRLRKARELMGMDQAPFAEHIGVSRGTVSNYERGLTEHYKPIVLRAWALASGVPLEWLESGTPPTNAPTPPDGGEALRRLTAAKQGRSQVVTARRGATPRYRDAA